jgi:hypothetical protein
MMGQKKFRLTASLRQAILVFLVLRAPDRAKDLGL